ncbi:hypothetical protein EPH_0010510 [Eimeria praecox]|uniref:Uncharacterized protein n=1 Tax=Eimeria praecox TaxID=51316 RepID=U6GPW9_9EIME|nr:hypothetical protein EPH_0010510 [Eimeria praecox]
MTSTTFDSNPFTTTLSFRISRVPFGMTLVGAARSLAFPPSPPPPVPREGEDRRAGLLFASVLPPPSPRVGLRPPRELVEAAASDAVSPFFWEESPSLIPSPSPSLDPLPGAPSRLREEDPAAPRPRWERAPPARVVLLLPSSSSSLPSALVVRPGREVASVVPPLGARVEELDLLP